MSSSKRRASHQFVNQNSSAVEYYTPPEIIEAVRKTMGGIDLDPASSARANEKILATRFFTVEYDGMSREWHGDVWLNHPFGRPEEPCNPDCARKFKNPDHVCHSFPLYGNKAWIDKLLHEFEHNHISQACCITYACTSEVWFEPLLQFPQCFLKGRTNYYLPDGTIKKGVTKGSVVTYLGRNKKAFSEAFKNLGIVKVRWTED